MKLQRILLKNGIPYGIADQNGKHLTAFRDKLPLTHDVREDNELYFSEFMFESFRSGAKLLWLEVSLVHYLRDSASIEPWEYEVTNAFMLNDSFFGWRYRLMPNIPKESWRYNIDYLVLYLIEDGQSDLLQSYFETVITPKAKMVLVPLHLIRTLIFEEPV